MANERQCGDEYTDGYGEIHVCVLPAGHTGTHADTMLSVDSPESTGTYWWRPEKKESLV